MATRTMVFTDAAELAAMQARLLAYHRLTVPTCIATIWDTPIVSGYASTITADDRVSGSFTANEASVNIVAEGESITDGTGAATGLDYLTQLMALSNWTGKGINYNQGNPSQTIAALISQYASEVYPLRPLGAVTAAWLLLMIGLKDIGTVANGGLARLPAAVLTDVESYLTTANNDGFTTVLLTTNTAGTWAQQEKDYTATLNGLYMASSVPDYKVDSAAGLVAPPNTLNGTNSHFADHVHPNATGYGVIAAAINAAITP